MTVMDAKRIDAPDRTRAAVSDLARLTMPDVPAARAMASRDADFLGMVQTSAQIHRALALYTLGRLEPTGKTRVADTAAAPAVRPRRKASPKAIALLERFKAVPSVDPHRFREDVDRVLDPGL